MLVFADPLALTIPDPAPVDVEQRWVTIGLVRSAPSCWSFTPISSLTPKRCMFGLYRPESLHAGKDGSTKMADTKREMADEYDFSGGSRGKFFRENASMLPPIHLDPEVFASLREQAAAEGLSVSDLANRLLRRELNRPDPVG